MQTSHPGLDLHYFLLGFLECLLPSLKTKYMIDGKIKGMEKSVYQISMSQQPINKQLAS